MSDGGRNYWRISDKLDEVRHLIRNLELSTDDLERIKKELEATERTAEAAIELNQRYKTRREILPKEEPPTRREF